MRPTLAAVAVLVLSPLAGCGNDRVGSGSLFDVPGGNVTQKLDYPEAGLAVSVPKEFSVKPADAPQLFRASLNEAFVSSFAYRRSEQLPESRDELRTARRRLVAAAKERDKTFRLRESRLTKVAGAPAIELLGDQTIFEGRLRLRSLHVYKGNGEYVVELAAPRAAFGKLDRASFPGIRRSLKLTGRVKRQPKPAASKKGSGKRGSGKKGSGGRNGGKDGAQDPEKQDAEQSG
ncbi:MAG: hypothetical protein ACR2GL_05045 [Thermoleophilaceae bacterium]